MELELISLNNEVMFSSNRDDWETPKKLFDIVNKEFDFDLDPCSNGRNAKCDYYFTEEGNGLIKDWTYHTAFVNPPYSKGNQDAWVKKCFDEWQQHNVASVMLLPARTDTKRFHQYIYPYGQILFIPGRICFELNGKPITDSKGNPQAAPFPSMLVVFSHFNCEDKLQNIYKKLL